MPGKKNNNHGWFTYLIISIFFILSVSTAHGADAVSWLSTQAKVDGSYSTVEDKATSYQSTSEVVRAFYAVGESAQPGIQTTLQYLSNENYSGAEYLARNIITRNLSGNDADATLSELQTRLNPDGGLGELSGFDTTIVDTVFGLEAFGIAGYGTSQTAAYLVNRLITNQRIDGSWADGSNESSIYLTALASAALQTVNNVYDLDDAITNANSYLLDQSDTSGAVGNTLETALSVLAIAPSHYDKTTYQQSVDYLNEIQQVDGSWGSDVYTTAVALRALYVAQTATPPNPTKGSVSGYIKDGMTGEPLEGVLVMSIGAETKSASTDANGLYIINDLTPGDVSLSAARSGYITASASGVVTAGNKLTYSPILTTDPTPIPIKLIGSVVNASDNTPLSDVNIKVLNSTYSVLTDGSGVFQIDGVPGGSITVEVSLDGYINATFVVSAPSGGEIDLGVIKLIPGTPSGTHGSIVGLVTDAQSKQPLNGVQITLAGADNNAAFTGADGRFEISEVTPGDITITASLDGYHASIGSGSIDAGSVVNYTVDLVRDINPALVTVKGTVVDAETQSPIQGAISTITGSNLQAETAADGGFQILGQPAGTFNVVISKAEYVDVTYGVSATGGGLADLGVVKLAKDVPVTGNNPPTITSNASTAAFAGYTYNYQVEASDPDGDPITFGLSEYPGGMEIDSQTGKISWIPTANMIGQNSFTVVVSDSHGAVTVQSVIVHVQINQYPSYVITDVETLNGLTVDKLVPNNYVLGEYVNGGRSGTWKAAHPDGCGFAYINGSSDLKAAGEALDFWSNGSGYGDDVVWDLGKGYSTVSIFPLIDHPPFPQEGIEYTIWGSNDPNATFPEGWKLGTLVTIYGQGWADNKSKCVGYGVNIDDYAGLYTFADESYRYIRLKADNSISIFDTPEHTTYSSYIDDGAQPGWQSIESEIDAVGGMICDVKPVAEAGDDIVGITNETIQQACL